MNYKVLKYARVALAVLFIVLISVSFLDFRDWMPTRMVNSTLYLQFIPSLLNFFKVLSISVIGFAVVILLTALFGRVYCSAICPLGIFQDVVARISRLFKKRKKYRKQKPYPWLRYSILAGVILLFFISGPLILSLTDPYSIYGKFMVALFKPALLFVNNGLASVAASMNVYSIYNVDPVYFPWQAMVVASLLFLLIVIMSGKWARLYCNTICPVGTLLGLISSKGLFRIHIDNESCTLCGKCQVSCKAGCIDLKNKAVDNSRCVSCYNCLTVCQDDAIHYRTKKATLPVAENKNEVDTSNKRDFLRFLIAGLVGLWGIRQAKARSPLDPININPTTVPINRKYTVIPPGSMGLDHFKNACTACQLCVNQCPTGVLQPSVTELGIEGFMQPFMNYNQNYCEFECHHCTNICPTGAILPLKLEEKKTTQIGKVTFIKENCVVYTENTACGSCSEHCPTQAVRMVPYIGDLTIPETDNSICIGCGACEYACPVIPFKAIYVDGNPIHELAQKPESKKVEEDEIEEFPF